MELKELVMKGFYRHHELSKERDVYFNDDAGKYAIVEKETDEVKFVGLKFW